MKISIITQSFIIKQALLKSFENNFPNIQLKILTNIVKDTNMQDNNIVILDCQEDDESNIEIIEHLKKQNIKVVVLDTKKSDILCKKVIQAGIDGYITEFASEEEFVYIMNKILSGSKFFDSQIVQQALRTKHQKYDYHLTKRENQVVNLVTKGFNNKEIAKYLEVSECTVKKHISNILDKLHFKSRQDIIIYTKDNYGIG